MAQSLDALGVPILVLVLIPILIIALPCCVGRTSAQRMYGRKNRLGLLQVRDGWFTWSGSACLYLISMDP